MVEKVSIQHDIFTVVPILEHRYGVGFQRVDQKHQNDGFIVCGQQRRGKESKK